MRAFRARHDFISVGNGRARRLLEALMRPLSLNAVDDLRRKLDALPTDGPVHVLLEAFARWRDEASRFGAAIAFHAVLALAGGLVLASGLVALWSPGGSAQGLKAATWMLWAGVDAPRLRALIEAASGHPLGVLASALALVAVVVGIAGVNAQLRRGFNAMADSARLPTLETSMLGRRLAGAGTVCATGLAILASVAASAGTGMLADSSGLHLPGRAVGMALALGLLDVAFAAALLTLAFVGLLQQLPDKPAGAEAVWTGGAIGGVLVALIAHLVGRGLLHAETGTLSGVAVAALVGMLAVYVGVQALLFSAAWAASAHEAHGHRKLVMGRREPAVAAATAQVPVRAGAATTSLAAFRARAPVAAQRRQASTTAPQGKPAVLLQFPKRGQTDGKSRRTP